MFDKDVVKYLEGKARDLRRNVVYSVGVNYPGHIGGSFSAADVMAALYFHKMKHDPQNRYMADRDRVILSKGHIAILQYSALAEAGYFPKEELRDTKQLYSMLQGHPDLIKSGHIGIEAGTGSLGQGLSIGCGMALGLRMDNNPATTYVIMGDGELAEGQNWEAAMAAARFGLDNLVAIVDKNDKQAQGTIEGRFSLGSIADKWRAFGWNVLEIDGHDMEDILKGLYAAGEAKGVPSVIVSSTVKGKGLDFSEAHPVGFHNAPLTQEQYDAAMAVFSGEEN
ncbi:MAG: transketolase [Defluviitaleaceae bacterium]|nr:transketolase [Defluviitaleaceae bacterium]